MNVPTPAGPERSLILGSAADAWRFLERQGGLDPVFYDAPIVAALRSALHLPEDEDLAAALARQEVGVEDFIGAFFEAVEPYSRMMTDLLSLFAEAGARHGDHNLRLEFDFGRELALGFDVRQFRDWLEVWNRVPRQATRIWWDTDSLWQLSQILRQNLPPTRAAAGAANRTGAEGTSAETWAREYTAGTWPEHVPPAPLSGDADLDRALHGVWHVWSTVVRESARISRDRSQLREAWQQQQRDQLADSPRPRESGDAAEEPRRQPRIGGLDRDGEATEDPPREEREEREPWPLRLLASLDSNNWPIFLAVGLYGTAEASAVLHPLHHAALSQTVHAIDDLVARQPKSVIDIESWERALRDFLNLPVWQRRHELYSAWIWTQIVAALNPYQRHIYQEDGRIRFSFAGSHLATFPRLDPELHLWAELRSPLAEAPWWRGRKRQIQPDYTLIHSPITSKESAVLVVECKQYRSSSTANFLHALVDYAHGRPSAQIILVNYGPAREGILDAAPADLRDRISLIGRMLPGSPAVTKFRRQVRAAVALRYPSGESPSLPPAAPELVSGTTALATTGVVITVRSAIRRIVLKWKQGPHDLDLHLHLRDQHGLESSVSFRSKGSLAGPPWAQLDVDAKRGGAETITIARLVGRYRCLVHNWSDDEPLTNSRAEVEIEHSVAAITVCCPGEGTGRYWHVFEYDADTGKLEVLNTLSDSA